MFPFWTSKYLIRLDNNDNWINLMLRINIQFNSVAQSCLTLCSLMDCSMPDFPVHHHQLPELTQTHVQ